jgi:ferritin-like protein
MGARAHRIGRLTTTLVGLKPDPQGGAMSHEGYHEPVEELPDTIRDMHRGIASLIEELEAIDWYAQRVAVCKDDELKRVLEHNRDEEKEHAAMTLEWIRRHDPKFSHYLKEYLFTTGPIEDKGHD